MVDRRRLRVLAEGVDVSALRLATVAADDYAFGRIFFETGRPVRFSYYRRASGAAQKHHFGGTFGQDIEPAGRYMNHRAEGPEGWHPPGLELGEVTFENPLVLHNLYYGPEGWKQRLVDAFGAKGKALSKKIRAAGYDGIVTVDGRDVSEIVDLTGF